MTTDTREALAAARSALGQLIEAGKAVKEALDTAIPDGEPVHPESRRLTWPISSGLLALDAVDAALAAQAAQPSAQGEAVARIDPMQNPMRLGVFMNYAKDETPAEMVLRKLACWLGVGGYNATTVDAEAFHRKIVEGVQMLVASASAPAAPAQAVPLTPREIELIDVMIDVQLYHAKKCDSIANRTMAEKQKGWDMERVELLRKLRGIAPKAAQETKA